MQQTVIARKLPCDTIINGKDNTSRQRVPICYNCHIFHASI